ncbi:MAG: Rrf2 family transcriptional regulator [Actinobacteria bacterium]|nr:Rrf2 family transcriptional regulator [Actinomycetota bacterium]
MRKWRGGPKVDQAVNFWGGMQFHRNAEYAVKVLIDLAQYGGATAGAIAPRRAMPRPYALKILRRMRDQWLVEAKRGQGGGYRLALDPGRITLWQVLTLMQGPHERNRCLFSSDGQCRITRPCPVHQVWDELWQGASQALGRVTIADISRVSAPSDGLTAPSSA